MGTWRAESESLFYDVQEPRSGTFTFVDVALGGFSLLGAQVSTSDELDDYDQVRAAPAPATLSSTLPQTRLSSACASATLPAGGPLHPAVPCGGRAMRETCRAAAVSAARGARALP